ncbi:MAG: hypothetical protein R2822_15325 [Spirosomataceae bacterium]
MKTPRRFAHILVVIGLMTACNSTQKQKVDYEIAPVYVALPKNHWIIWLVLS